MLTIYVTELSGSMAAQWKFKFLPVWNFVMSIMNMIN
jgi:hypothetical protein